MPKELELFYTETSKIEESFIDDYTSTENSSEIAEAIKQALVKFKMIGVWALEFEKQYWQVIQ